MNSINSVSSAVCRSCNVYISWLFISTLTLFIGCGDSNPVPIADSSSDRIEDKSQEKIPANSLEKAKPDDQLDRLSLSNSRLAESEASEGWIKLFDGVTLFGWETDGKANFRVEDGLLVVDEGEMSLLCTSMKWDNYELLVEYRADSEVNSGIFLNTELVPGDVATECYEINIAPSSHPFSTGSLVNREAASNVPTASGDNWRTLKISHRSGELSINLDGVDVCKYEDPKPPSAGKIGLQHNSGRIEFRRVMLRPLDLKSLLDSDLALWKQYPDMDAKYSVTEAGWMRVQGGSGQIETSEQYDDFVLLAEYKLPTPEMNSGIFFR
ncbi:MAG: family 16 glycoside hydrolase, partial [Planctomycetota bacterium]|nr:family 16 glycoside hydrolase [Planctomycetota bacterium]